VTPPRQGSLGTRSHASLEEMNKTRGNLSKLIQARKTLVKRDRVLTAAIRRCHIELAKRKSLSEIEASKDEVEAAWNEFNHATARYCMHAGGELHSRKELDEQPEEARRAWYEWKALSNMMDEVVDKAEEYLEESATRENYYDDRDDGGKLDAKVEQLSTVDEVNMDEVNMDEVNMDEVNMDEVNMDEVNMDEVNMDEVNVDEVNADEVNVDEVNVNEVKEVNEENKVNVNKESTMNEDSGEVCNIKEVAPMSILEGNEVELHSAHIVLEDIKEEMSEGKSFEVMRRGTFAAKFEVRTSWEPGESAVVAKLDEEKSDVNAKAKVEASGVKKVTQLDGLTMMKMKEQSRPAYWDPGELPDAKDQMEMLDVEEVANLVNDDKVARSGHVKAMMFFYALHNLMLYTSEALVALCMARFVNSFSPQSIVEVSDYG